MSERENEDEQLFFPDELDRLSISEAGDDEDTVEDETIDEPTHEEKTETTRPTDERMTEASTKENTEGYHGMIEGGLDLNETILLLGLTALSYGFGWGVLTVMVEEGLSSAPLTLWAILGLLVSVPLLALFGTSFSDSLNQMIGR